MIRPTVATGSWTPDDPLLPTNDPAWTVVSDSYDQLRDRIIQSRFTISNGFLGVEAGPAITPGDATTQVAQQIVPARTYVAGLFDTPEGDNAVPELVPAPDWLHVRILLSGQEMKHHPDDLALHHMTLDMKRGALFDEGNHSMASGLDGRVSALRLVSLSDRALGLQVIQFELGTGTTEITFSASIEATGLVPERIQQDLGLWRTPHSGRRLAMATASSLHIDGLNCLPTATGPLGSSPLGSSPLGSSPLGSSWTWTARPGQLVCFARIVAVVRGDAEAVDPAIAARTKLDEARRIGWRGVLAAHEAAWVTRWQSSDIVIDGDPAAQRALRFAIYHLNSAANPDDEHVSIGARALTGEDYRGHVFWDTDIFLLPFYVLTWPEAARSLLMYRFHTLDGARSKAAGMGWRGALYAWESADTGAEATPAQVIAPDLRIVDVLCGKQEQHISADVAYTVWQYWLATGDETFLCDAGAEIILETARFWASRAALESDGHCHIRGVIGPDEYHENIDDNAYTNVMAAWNIRRALDVAALLGERWPACWTRLSSRLGLTGSELKQWQDVADRMATGFDPRTGMIEQFAGYFALEDIDPRRYAARAIPIDIVLGKERTQRSQLVKQADVVALLALLPEAFPPGAFPPGADVANFRYYEPRCSHGSSLSPAMHGLVAARLGDTAMALHYMRQAATIDLGDTVGVTAGGVHIAALGGIWMLVVFGFAGVSLRNDSMAINPFLPAAWHSLTFCLQWRGRRIRLSFDRDAQRVEATLVSGETMTLTVSETVHQLHPDVTLNVSTATPSVHSTQS
jgi:trehalose/maltose hydrolase-like predicted phosphorylase